MSHPDREPDREYRFSIFADPQPTPQEFVEILTAEGFSFESTVCPIQLREPKRRFEDGDFIVYQQWDNS